MIKFLEENGVNEPQTGHTSRQLTMKGLTGANLADIMSNIYDLEGNNFEWTAEIQPADEYYPSKRVMRGGGANGDKNSVFTASMRFGDDANAYWADASSRNTLYLGM